MPTLAVGILGLNRVGASLGLALRRYTATPNADNQFKVTAYDETPSVREAATRQGIADTLANTPEAAVRGQDLIVLTTPYSELADALALVGAAARPGAVVVDVSPLKGAAQRLAAKHLPAEVHLVGFTPLLNPSALFDGADDVAHARADLFDGGVALLAPAPTASGDAIELVSTLAQLLSMTPRFVDAAEHDGLAAATEGVPLALSVAAFAALSSEPGWEDAQRLTNAAFGRLTAGLLSAHPDDLRDQLLHNRDNLTRLLANVEATLGALRAAIAANDRDTLEALLAQSQQRYAAWHKRRVNGRWDDDDEAAAETARNAQSSGRRLLTGLLGDYIAGRLSGDERNGKNKR